MSSPARIEANRRNAQQSTGPRTPEGKARSAANALRHGLASISPHSFLAAEDRAAFERMLAGYLRTYQPQHTDEVDLLTDAVFCKWRQQRLWTVEAQTIEIAIAEHQHDLQKKLPKANIAAHVAHGFAQTAPTAQLNRRYEAQLHRQYLRNLKELRDLQAARTEVEPTLDELYPNEPNPSPAPPAHSGPSHPDSGAHRTTGIANIAAPPDEPIPSPAEAA